MKPNIFIEQTHCAEDFFSYSLAYILNLFPHLGQKFVDQIAVRAGKKPGYFGEFQDCEFIGLEFPQGHTASRPDLRLACSARTIYFENKLESPLNVAQMKRHADLMRHDTKNHLMFVSNISHRNPDLRSIARYIHPTDKDHFLWLDLLPALEPHNRKASLAARIITDFREALKLRGMVGRIIKGAKGSLYTPSSDANHLALSQLSKELQNVGFKVVNKPVDEQTLRVYPSHYREYPLLNPRFYATATWLDSKLDYDCLIFTVLSRSGVLHFDRGFAQFPAHRDCVYISDPYEDANGYTYHGHFVLRVKFLSERGASYIDFPSLVSSLKRILGFLTRPSKQKVRASK